MNVAKILKIPISKIQPVLQNFHGLAGRLELIKIINGVTIYNDTNSTTPDATLAGLRAIGQKRNVVLIVGGSDKGLDMSELVSEIPNYCREVVLLPGSGTEKLLIANKRLGITAKNLKEAVGKAIQVSNKGDIILFSPAFASFGMFKNEYDRGEQFVKIISDL